MSMLRARCTEVRSPLNMIRLLALTLLMMIRSNCLLINWLGAMLAPVQTMQRSEVRRSGRWPSPAPAGIDPELPARTHPSTGFPRTRGARIRAQ